MKQILFCLTILISLTLSAQSGDCEFPETWVVDESSIITTQTIRIEGKESRLDTLDQSVSKDLISLPESVSFKDGSMTLFYSMEANKPSQTGSYKLTNRKFAWKMKDEEVMTSTKVMKDDIACKLINDGIPFFLNVPKNVKGKGVVVSYTLVPSE